MIEEIIKEIMEDVESFVPGTWIPTGSETIPYAKYNPLTLNLELQFEKGETYDYTVSPATFVEFMLAESKGRYFHQHIR